MQKRTSPQRKQPVVTYLRRHWLLIGVIAFFAGVAVVGAPAWAAPSPRPLNQTVPRPTPTSEGAPVATATPRPDNGDDEEDSSSTDSGSTGGGGGVIELDTGLPNQLLQNDAETGTSGSAPANGSAPSAPALTANVAVSQLNLRAQPDTTAEVLGGLNVSEQVTVEARNADGSWWYVCCLAGTETRGWVSAQFMTPSFARSQANDLIPVFDANAVSQMAMPSADASAAASAEVQQAASPLALDFKIDPPFLWQGITGTLTITVTNPNEVDVVRAELSDELPAPMIFMDARVDADGEVTTTTTDAGSTLLIFRWPRVVSQTSVTAVIDFEVAETLENGEVFDNLVGVSGGNAGYSTGAITIGMPPVLPPGFD